MFKVIKLGFAEMLQLYFMAHTVRSKKNGNPTMEKSLSVATSFISALPLHLE